MQNEINPDLATMLGMPLIEVRKSLFASSLKGPSRTELIEDEFHMEFRNAGITFVGSFDGRVQAILLHAREHEEYQEYQGPLPEGIRFGDSRKKVRKALGEPTATGGGEMMPLLGEKAQQWDRYDWNSYSLHFEYAEGEKSIDLVTLMRPDAVPTEPCASRTA